MDNAPGDGRGSDRRAYGVISQERFTGIISREAMIVKVAQSTKVGNVGKSGVPVGGVKGDLDLNLYD